MKEVSHKRPHIYMKRPDRQIYRDKKETDDCLGVGLRKDGKIRGGG